MAAPRLRSPAGAALLSFLLPGLGQAAVGKPRRGLILAIPWLAVLVVLVGLYAFSRRTLFDLALDSQSLALVLAIDLILLPYHAWVIVDAYLIARIGSRQPLRPIDPAPPRLPQRSSSPGLATWASLGAVALLLASTVAVHGAVAAVDTGWQHDLACLTAPTPCWVTADGSPLPSLPGVADASASPTPFPLGTLSTTAPVLPSFDLGALPSFTTTVSSWSWDPNGQFNVLLAGIGVEYDPSQLGPDTIMVLHVDRATGRAALISIGRNNICVPLPQGVAQHFATPQHGCPAYTWPGLINDFPNEVLGHCEVSPLYADTCGQANDPNRYLRAYRTFEEVIGGLLGLQIDGSVWINPVGLTRLLDDVGGVTIDVTTTLHDEPCGPPGTWEGKFGYCADTHDGYAVPTGDSGVQRMKDFAASSDPLLSISWTDGHDIAFTMKPGLQHLDGLGPGLRADPGLQRRRLRARGPSAGPPQGPPQPARSLLVRLAREPDPAAQHAVGCAVRVQHRPARHERRRSPGVGQPSQGGRQR